jgi:hypothetical protein
MMKMVLPTATEHISYMQYSPLPSFSSSLMISELDAETISALGDVQDLNEALDGIELDATGNPAAGH